MMPIDGQKWKHPKQKEHRNQKKQFLKMNKNKQNDEIAMMKNEQKWIKTKSPLRNDDNESKETVQGSAHNKKHKTKRRGKRNRKTGSKLKNTDEKQSEIVQNNKNKKRSKVCSFYAF
eukprot:285834_1